MNFPPSSPCARCGSMECQTTCRFVSLIPSMSHAQALQTARDVGLTLGQTREAFALREAGEAA